MITHLLFPVFKSNECLQVKEGRYLVSARPFKKECNASGNLKILKQREIDWISSVIELQDTALALFYVTKFTTVYQSPIEN